MKRIPFRNTVDETIPILKFGQLQRKIGNSAREIWVQANDLLEWSRCLFVPPCPQLLCPCNWEDLGRRSIYNFNNFSSWGVEDPSFPFFLLPSDLDVQTLDQVNEDIDRRSQEPRWFLQGIGTIPAEMFMWGSHGHQSEAAPAWCVSETVCATVQLP